MTALSVSRAAFITITPALNRSNQRGCLTRSIAPTCSARRLHRMTLSAAAVPTTDATLKPRGDKLVVVGLGNPGPRFTGTRHNVGFEVVDTFAARHGGTFSSQKGLQSDIAITNVGQRTVYVVKPRTFMNLSGDAVRAVMRQKNVPADALLVVADDMALDVGRLRLRAKGSAGGHNGLKSIESRLGSREYVRLKVGVGSPRLGAEEWKSHVLGKFSRVEEGVLEEVILDCMDVLDLWVTEPDISRVINLAGTLSAKKK